jgi:hypothetical protein
MHVMEWTNEENLAVLPRDGRGIPVREAYPEPEYAGIQALMDEAYATGKRRWQPYPGAWLIVDPRLDASGRVVGVATAFVVTADQPVVTRPRLLPDLQSPGLPPAEAGTRPEDLLA